MSSSRRVGPRAPGSENTRSSGNENARDRNLQGHPQFTPINAARRFEPAVQTAPTPPQGYYPQIEGNNQGSTSGPHNRGTQEEGDTSPYQQDQDEDEEMDEPNGIVSDEEDSRRPLGQPGCTCQCQCGNLQSPYGSPQESINDSSASSKHGTPGPNNGQASGLPAHLGANLTEQDARNMIWRLYRTSLNRWGSATYAAAIRSTRYQHRNRAHPSGGVVGKDQVRNWFLHFMLGRLTTAGTTYNDDQALVIATQQAVQHTV